MLSVKKCKSIKGRRAHFQTNFLKSIRFWPFTREDCNLCIDEQNNIFWLYCREYDFKIIYIICSGDFKKLDAGRAGPKVVFISFSLSLLRGNRLEPLIWQTQTHQKFVFGSKGMVCIQNNCIEVKVVKGIFSIDVQKCAASGEARCTRRCPAQMSALPARPRLASPGKRALAPGPI